VTISTDEFRPLDEHTSKQGDGFDPMRVSTDSVYVDGFLSGCKSSLDY
jgi:hypothetical protein